jgi:hypothetical protein
MGFGLEDTLPAHIEGIGFGRRVADCGEAESAVFGQRAHHVEDRACLSGMIEMQSVAGHHVEQIVGCEGTVERRSGMGG